MKLDYYIKTDNTFHIGNFIDICKQCNIKTVDLESKDFMYGDDYIGIGLFIKPKEITHPDSIKSADDIQVDVSALYICEEASWWKKIKVTNYEDFIRNFDVNDIKSFLYDKFVDIRQKFPDVTTIGCSMLSELDIEYGWYKNEKHWKPYILKSYCYSAVSNQWGPHTNRGFGDFDRFYIWDDKYLDMDKKQIRKHIKDARNAYNEV